MTIHDHAGQPYVADLIEGEKFRELERENVWLRDALTQIEEKCERPSEVWNIASKALANGA